MNAKQRRKARRADLWTGNEPNYRNTGWCDVYFGAPAYTQPVRFTAKDLGLKLGEPLPWDKLTEAMRRVSITVS